MAPRSAKGRDDVLGEELHPAHLLLPRHETLVEEPAEPLEVTLAAKRLQLLDLAFHLRNPEIPDGSGAAPGSRPRPGRMRQLISWPGSPSNCTPPRVRHDRSARRY
jgi:hypothetical protein